MTTRFRVDVAKKRVVPCGMTSIRYMGDNFKEAKSVFHAIQPGIDAWDRPDDNYGVILSEWNCLISDYVVSLDKGLSKEYQGLT